MSLPQPFGCAAAAKTKLFGKPIGLMATIKCMHSPQPATVRRAPHSSLIRSGCRVCRHHHQSNKFLLYDSALYPGQSIRTRCTATQQATTLKRQLEGEAAIAWDASLSELQPHMEDLDAESTEKLIERAFGWGSQAFWRGSKVEAVPSQGQVAAVIDYLNSLGIKGSNLTKFIKKFPEVLACSVEEQLKVSVAKLEGDWKLKGDVLTRALLRQPQVLGYSVDCEGSCIGECNRCWARF